jgi:hypothetical protein
MKKITLFFLAFIFCLAAISQSLQVSKTGRYLETSDGKPFIWLGDTGWELFHRLNREEATEYLNARAKQGFSVIQAVVLAENDGLRVPNPYGEVPLIDLLPEKPNEKYFEHVDFIIRKANELGLYVGLLPTWGDKLYSLHPAAGPVVFNEVNAEKYGEFLGKRYKSARVIWILGGDRNIDSEEVLNIWRAMARGLRKGDGGAHLIGFHPRGESSSSYWLHNEEWLDFNLYQSGHARRFNQVYDYAQSDYLKQPVKPVIDGEPAYEGIPVRFYDYCDWSKPLRVPDAVLNEDGTIRDLTHFREGFFSDYDIRVHAYWNFLSGTCGYTYGNNAIWQFYKRRGPIAIPCLGDWKDAMENPGANQIRHIRKLFEQFSLSKLVPDQSVVYGPIPAGSGHIRAAGSVHGTFAIIYLAQGQPVEVVMKKLSARVVTASWYNPRTGETTQIGEYGNKGIRRFTPPSRGDGNDWVLLLTASENVAEVGK